jgi:hypothetical protein
LKTPSRLAYKGRVLLDSPDATQAQRDAAHRELDALKEADLLAAAAQDSAAGRRALERFAKLVSEGKQPSQEMLQYVAARACAVLALRKAEKAGPWRKALNLSTGRAGRERSGQAWARTSELALAVAERSIELNRKRQPGARPVTKAVAIANVAKERRLEPETVANAYYAYWGYIGKL